jgi:hypothetical protein
MSIALKSESGDFIYLDVVTNYSHTFQSQVSQHPVDGSGTVSDNVTKQNLIIKLKGSITGADFNSGKPKTLSSEDKQFIGIGQVVVEGDIASVIEVKSVDSFTNLLPDVAGQFFTDVLPTIEGISEGRSASYSEAVLFKVLESFHADKENLTVFEFDKGSRVAQRKDMFMTGLSLTEGSESGDALEFDITLEHIKFSSLLEVIVEVKTADEYTEKSVDSVNKGEQPSAEIVAPKIEDETDSFLRSIEDSINNDIAASRKDIDNALNLGD